MFLSRNCSVRALPKDRVAKSTCCAMDYNSVKNRFPKRPNIKSRIAHDSKL